MIKLATASMHVVHNKEDNLNKILQLIDEAAGQGANLLALPEQCLQGYLPSLSSIDMEHYRYQYDNAETLPDGASVQKIIEKAKEKNIYVVFGMTEKDSDIKHKLYNVAVLVGPEGFVGKYRKVHIPLNENFFYYAGDTIPVFETQIGRIGLIVCYDKMFPESSRIAAVKGADIIVTPLAWRFADAEKNKSQPEKDPDFDKFVLYDRVRALENQVFFISSNQYGHCGETDYLGCSNIVSPFGEILSTTGHAEKIAYAEVDVDGMIYDGKTIGMGGSNMIRERRPDVYQILTEQKPNV